MGDPVAPALPADAPQDVKDFFDCKGDKLVWKKGKVTWLGLPLEPDVSFEHGKAKGSIDITIDFPLIPKFTINASVNDAGELVVDTSKIPDLSGIKEGMGKKGVDDSISNINAWFKKNGKKLKGATFKKGEVTLEKTPLTTSYAPPVEVPRDDDLNRPQNVSLPVPVATGDEWDAVVLPPDDVQVKPAKSVFIMPLLLITFVVAILGFITGFVVLGGNGPGLVANASPTVPPTAGPTQSRSASPAASPTVTPSPTAATGPTPTSSLASYVSGVCARVKHSAYQSFVSYIDWAMYSQGYDIDHFTLFIEGTNDDAPVTLTYDPVGGDWTARLGLHEPGDKTISQLVAVLSDGTSIDVTDELVALLPSDVLHVRYPQEDTFGTCPQQ